MREKKSLTLEIWNLRASHSASNRLPRQLKSEGFSFKMSHITHFIMASKQNAYFDYKYCLLSSEKKMRQKSTVIFLCSRLKFYLKIIPHHKSLPFIFNGNSARERRKSIRLTSIICCELVPRRINEPSFTSVTPSHRHNCILSEDRVSNTGNC